jgi:hypothetical protein
MWSVAAICFQNTAPTFPTPAFTSNPGRERRHRLPGDLAAAGTVLGRETQSLADAAELIGNQEAIQKRAWGKSIHDLLEADLSLLNRG